MATIRWTEESTMWMKDIYDYISKDSISIANKVIDDIYEKAQILQTMPEIGYKYQNRDDLRILLYGHYRIAYLIKEDEVIDILGVFHGSLDIENYLKG